MKYQLQRGRRRVLHDALQTVALQSWPSTLLEILFNAQKFVFLQISSKLISRGLISHIDPRFDATDVWNRNNTETYCACISVKSAMKVATFSSGILVKSIAINLHWYTSVDRMCVFWLTEYSLTERVSYICPVRGMLCPISSIHLDHLHQKSPCWRW